MDIYVDLYGSIWISHPSSELIVTPGAAHGLIERAGVIDVADIDAL